MSFAPGTCDSAHKALWREPETLRRSIFPVSAGQPGKRDSRTEAQIGAILDRQAAGEDSDG